MSINAQPFQPQFKLIGNLLADQVLVYDTSEGAFVNSTASGGGGASGYDAVANMGTGTALYYGDAGTTLQLNTLLGGTDITITDNGSGGLIVASTSTDTVQDGTNLGTGTGIFDSKDGTTHALQFKSIVAGAGLTITDDGAGTLTLVNTNAAGTTDADLTLSNLSDNATARTNLGVYSKTESDATYHKHDDAFVPSANNVHDIGSPTLKYNDIYAETFQGTAVLADNLTTSGTTGQVLTYNGSTWTAADTSGGTLLGLADVSTVVPNDGQHLVWNTTTSLWTPSASGAGGGGYQDSDARNAISVAGDLTYNATTGVMSYTTPTDTDTTYTAGTGLTLVGTVFSNTAPDQTVALTGSGATTITGTYPNFTIASTDTNTDTDTTYTAGTNVTISGSNVISSTDTNTTYTSSDFTHNSLSGVGANEHIDWTTDQGSTNIHASNYTNTDTDTTYTAGTNVTISGSNVISSTDTNTTYTNVSEFINDAGYLTSETAHYTNSDVDTHLNVSGATNNQMLKWTGTDYAWVTSTDTDTTYTAGTGLLLTGTVFSNTSPDQTVALTGTGATTVTGTYPNFTITSTDTNTDTNTEYTAGTGLTLAGTVFSLTSGHFDGAYSSLTGAPTIPSGNQIIDWTTDQGATNIHAGNYTDTNTTYVSSDFTHSGLSGVVANEHIDWTVDQGATNIHVDNYTDTNTTYSNLSEFTNDSGYLTTTGVLSSHTDVHTAAPSDGDVLKWDNANSRWAASADAIGSVTATSTTVFTNKSGNISQWTNDAGYLTSETDSQTLSLTGTTLAITGGNNVDLGALTIDDMADVNITSVSDGQFLKYDNASGDWLNETVTIPTLTSQLTNDAGFLTSETAHYADSDVDTHLNQSNPTSGFVLSWNGSDYAWVSNGAAGAHFDGDYNSLTNKLTAGTNVSISGTNVISATDTNTDTLYTAGTGLTLAGTVFSNTSPDQTVALTGTGATTVTGTYPNFTINSTDTDTNTIYANSDVDTHLNTGSATNNQILSWTGTDYDWIANSGTPAGYNNTNWDTAFGWGDHSTAGYTTGAHYANSDVDLHLNKGGSVTGGYILSWTGSDYDWIANSGTPAWSAITNKPTTIAGFGITDAFDGAYGSLSGAPTIPSGNQIIDWTADQGSTNIHASNYTDTNTTYTNVSEFTNDSGYLVSGDLSGYALTSSLATVGTTGLYSDLSGTPTIPSGNQIIDWTQSGAGTIHASNYASGGGGATDKIEEGNSSVEVIDGGANGHIMFNTNASDRWQVTNDGHIHPETNAAYDLGSADKKVRHLFLSDNSLYIEDNTIKTSGTNLLFNDEDVMDYDNLKNQPTITNPTAGTGIQVNSGVISLNSVLSGLTDVHTTSPTDGQVLAWDNGNSRWAPAAAGGTLAMNDLTDVDTSGISSGQYLQWNGSAFIASTVSGGGASAIDDLSDVDTTTSAPNNGDVLTWVTADSEWAPSAPSGGGGGGASVEYFKLNYATNGNLTSITNSTSGVSATILSATGGDTEITFSGASYPPSSILIYGYSYGTNEYVIMPLNKDIGTRKISGGGTAGSPTAFGSFSAEELTLKLREADTGSSRSFGTTTHAWIMFTMV